MAFAQRGEADVHCRVSQLRGRPGDTGGHLRTPVADAEQHRRARRMAQEELRKFQRRLVGPVQVVEHDRHRSLAGLGLEQQPHLLEQPVPVETGPPVHRPFGGAEQQLGQRGSRLERGHVDTERHVGLELGGLPVVDRESPAAGQLGQLGEQPGLAIGPERQARGPAEGLAFGLRSGRPPLC